MFSRAVMSGLQSVGCDVIDLGVVPTPTILLAVQHHKAIGGIGVTASHNPAEWNALKLVSSEAIFLDVDGSDPFVPTWLPKTHPVPHGMSWAR